jgi:hypothetical protein
MNLDNYADFAHRTGKPFRDAADSYMEAIMYASLGLCGETSEFVAKAMCPTLDKDACAKELGDIFWYFTTVCYCINLKPDYVIALNAQLLPDKPFNTLLHLSRCAGYVAERVKKLLRDEDEKWCETGLVPLNRQADIAIHLNMVYQYWHQCVLMIGYTPEQIIELNIKQLSSREARGVLKGDGDDR